MTEPSTPGVVWLLRAAIQRYGGEIRRALVEAGYADIPTRGLWAIGALGRCGGAAAPSVLVEELQVTKQAVSQLVEVLVALGYSRRDDDPNDRRRRVVTLTARGERAARVIEGACTVLDARVSRRLGAELPRLAYLLNEVLADEG